MKKSLYFLLFFLIVSKVLKAQISAPGSSASDKTFYPTFTETDSIFLFCTADSTLETGALMVTTQLEGTKTFLWEKYNNETTEFEFYFQESSDGTFSEILDLANGCYRATVTQGANTEIYRAWVFNNWFTADAYVYDSNCESFKMQGEFKTAELYYYDLLDNAEIPVVKDVQVEWLEGEVKFASNLNPEVINPPTEDTDYTFRVHDRYDCDVTVEVTYESIVTKANFSADPMNGEAPLTVTFNNLSENGTPGYFEWFLYRNLDDIKREAEETTEPIDSILLIAYDDAPVYTYENSGTYLVKLISKKVSEFFTCVDTFTLEDYIIVDTSFVAVPNVFTPNGDGTNDEFVVKFWSMQSIEISIFTRWGKRIHYWESGDIRGFQNTYSETVWDGRLMGGRFASPGVYYYNVVGKGRDGKRRRAHGF
ncbi:MAG: gliding motility-associated C-terminal domain-containing protein, partial [Draconibacterium sp.]|nr:gliding motility-associated C-terminal domain-containing protein [Draconibacterium sp.]